MKGHKQSLDKGNKENLDIDMHKYKSQVIQSMQEGNKLRFVAKNYLVDRLFKLISRLILIICMFIIVLLSFCTNIEPNK